MLHERRRSCPRLEGLGDDARLVYSAGAVGRLASFVLLLGCALLPASAWAQDETAPPPVPAEARAHLDRGDQLFEAGGFDAAVAEYQGAYDLMQSHPLRYLVLYNLAQCYERLSEYDVALARYRQYLDEGGAGEDDAAEVRGRISVLEGLLGTVTITLTWPDDVPEADRPSVEVWVADRQLAGAPGEIALPAGNHTIEIRAVGFDAQRETVTLTAGGHPSLSFVMRVTAPPSGLPPAVFIGSSIAAGLAVIAGASLGTFALVRHDQLASLPMARQSERTPDAVGEVKDYALVADVMYGTAVLFGAAAIVLFFATDWSSHDAPAAGATALRVAPFASPTGSGLWVEGTF